jgi:nucleoside-diphosphate-sugar epimerase
MTATWLITGATGFVGGHLAEACTSRGLTVRTIARPDSEAHLLEALGVMVYRGDITDPAIVREAVAGADVIVHCAAKVGDWGRVDDYRAVNVEGLRQLLEACKGRPLRRFVHMSSLGVYAARHHHGTDENEPLPANHVDAYTQTKVEAERLALDYHRQEGVPVVVLRPGFIYGPRDRTLIPKVIDKLRHRQLRFIGSSKRALNTIFVGNLVEAIFLAVEKPQAVGQVYNLTDGEFVSKRQFIETIVQALTLPRPRPIPLPLVLARPLAACMEAWARRSGAKQAPALTQAGIKFLGLDLDFSIQKAKRELGYQPHTRFEDAMRQTMAWYKQKG